MADLPDKPATRDERAADLDAIVGGLRPAVAGVPEPNTDSWGRSERLIERLAPAFDFLYDRWFRTEVSGLAHVPEGGALLVANHAGAVPADAPQIVWAMRRHLGRAVYMMGDDLLSRAPFIGRAFRRMGGIEANPETGRVLLGREGQLGLVFPEGTKGTGKHVSDRYRLRRFGRGGFVRLAADAGVPIVPIAVMGAEEAMPVLADLPRVARLLDVPYVPVTSLMWLPVKFRIRVLEPVDVAEGATDDHSIQVHTDGIRALIQDALFELIAGRRSVVFG